ncbi:MAG: DNA-3-methyladenine glycosylase [Bacteroidota bacterium]
MAKLNEEFYLRDNVVQIASDLIGKYLFTSVDGMITSGVIVETEAYNGRTDKACHAHNSRFTERTKIMYQAGGVAYVYLCYGIHHLFNIVTNQAGLADAVLVRAIEPVLGVDLMEQRRNMSINKPALTSGPGSMSKALGISKVHYGTSLTGSQIWLEDGYRGDFEVGTRKRIGIDYAEEDKDLPWRFIMEGNKWVSKPNFGKL